MILRAIKKAHDGILGRSAETWALRLLAPTREGEGAKRVHTAMIAAHHLIGN